MISILYVDDEPGLLELCRIFLEQTGEFRVDTVESAQEALAMLATTQYDAIISDYQMPGMNGIGLLKSIREYKRDMPFILFTGRGREEVVIEAVNNGVDFYLQKGGDPKAQFVELMHKIRQSVDKRQAERGLCESEKRLTDIINFLPDPTFAIDRGGTVIAWNRAIEELTGVPAAGMIGKGDYEYAIPFYGYRRPILIDLIFEPDERIAEQYTGIRRENKVLTAETDLPRPQGRPLFLMGTASALYNRQGEIAGAIESIRDLTARKKGEDELQAAYAEISAREEELRAQYEALAAAESETRKKERQLRQITATIPGVVYQILAGHDGKITEIFASERSREIFSLDNSPDGAFERFTRCIHPDDRQGFLDSIGLAMKNKEQWNFEGRFIRPTGELIWFQAIASPVVTDNGVIFSGVLLDITARRKTEDALRYSESLYGALADSAQDLIYIINKDDTVAYVNRFAAKMIGRSVQDIIGRPRSALFSGPAGEHQYQSLRKVFESGVPLSVESRIPLPSGDSWQNTHLIPLKDSEGAVTAVLGISRDISGMKETEDALRFSESQYRSIIDNMQDMFYRTDLEGKLVMVSPAGARMAGYNSPEEMIGLDVARDLYVNPPQRKKFLALLSKKGSVVGYPVMLRARDGRQYHAIASSHYYYDTRGNVTGIEGLIHDVTDLRHAEEALREANRKLNLLNSITRHDVANQLTVLQGYTQLAMIKNPDPVAGDFLKKIDAVATTIARQIEFSKTYQELGVHAPDWFGLDGIFAKNRPKDILFSSSCAGVEVFADPMLEKVFANLFGNSVMHGGHVTRISVRCEPAGDELLITVEDNGVGIPLDEKQKIFKKGFGKNTGFGLFLAREILAITGISIHETGKHGSGARFEITVPKGGFRYSGDA